MHKRALLLSLLLLLGDGERLLANSLTGVKIPKVIGLIRDNFDASKKADDDDGSGDPAEGITGSDDSIKESAKPDSKPGDRGGSLLQGGAGALRGGAEAGNVAIGPHGPRVRGGESPVGNRQAFAVGKKR